MKKVFVFLIFLIAMIFFYRHLSQTNVAMILPSQIVCFFDQAFAAGRTQSIQSVIENLFQTTKDPEKVVELLMHDFSEIDSVQVQICQADKICFHVASSTALFLLNCHLVACLSGALVDAAFFDPDVIKKLPQLHAENKDELEWMISYIKQIDADLLELYDLAWLNKFQIFFVEKANRSKAMLTWHNRTVTFDDVKRSELIAKEIIASKKNRNKKYEYDLRFKNQIIVREGGLWQKFFIH